MIFTVEKLETPTIESAHRLIRELMTRDQFRMRNWLKKIRRSQDPEEFEKWLNASNRSRELCERRKAAFPSVAFDQSLPIYQRKGEIGEAIENHQVVVVSGETGSGKSTQLPLIALELGYGSSGLIGHTQPRRIAARGVASRIADQLNTKIGTTVGYKMRFADETKPETLVKLMTDGILLAETQSDRFLNNYDLIIVDEAHERSLNIDFLLGYLKRILAKRRDLRLVITSATIDTQRFAEHFTLDPEKPTPVINVEGRTFPVEIIYKESDSEIDQRDLHDQVVQSCLELASFDSGDILVFLPTEKDIRTVAKKLRASHFSGDAGNRRTEILPLYARLTTEQQNQIFQPHQNRRVVLATNVAESSITVPGIKYVVDTGTARISRYAPRSKVQRLPIEAVSQASANQRAGRCGRIEPGICIRLYGQEDYESRPKFTTPEIRRHQSGECDSANSIAESGRHRRVSIHRPAPSRDDSRRIQNTVRDWGRRSISTTYSVGKTIESDAGRSSNRQDHFCRRRKRMPSRCSGDRCCVGSAGSATTSVGETAGRRYRS